MNENEWPVGRIAEEKGTKTGATACRGEVLDEDPFSVRRGYTEHGKTVARERSGVIGHRLVILEHAATDGDEEKKDRRTAEGNGRETKQKFAARSWEARKDRKKQGRHSKRRRRPPMSSLETREIKRARLARRSWRVEKKIILAQKKREREKEK